MSQYSSPKIWGPHFWYMLRCIAHNYPTNPTAEDAQHVKTFYTELQYILPCEICKYTFRQHFNKIPLVQGLVSRAKLIEWVELIYEETKKVIQDKRVKILDMFDEDEFIKPVKVTYKQRIDPLEEKLNQIRQTVISAEKKQPLQIPLEPPKNTKIDKQVQKVSTNQQSNQQSNQLPLQQILPLPKHKPENKIYNINGVSNDDFEKVQHGYKIDIDKQVHHKNSQPKIDINNIQNLEKLKVGKKIDSDIEKLVLTSVDKVKHIPSKNNIHAAIINHRGIPSVQYTPPNISKQENSKQTITNKQTINIPKVNVPHKQTQIIIPKTSSDDLVITKRCKKCEH